MKNEDDDYIFTKSIRLKNGKTIYAYQYGLQAFRIKVRNKGK
jgi:hypothetical protein